MFNIKFLDSNRGPQVSEVTAFPTETQPLSKFSAYWIKNIDFKFGSFNGSRKIQYLRFGP